MKLKFLLSTFIIVNISMLFPLTSSISKAETVTVSKFSDDLSEASLLKAINNSLLYYKIKPKGAISYDHSNIGRLTLKRTLKFIKRALKLYGFSDEFYEFINSNFEMRSLTEEVVLTGYYEAELEGSLTKDEKFKYPIYKVPPELQSYKDENKPYYTREEIDFDGVLANRNLELAWTNDPIKLFFMHIQGSGKLKLPDGKIIDIQYADNNGRTYRAIARKLLDEKAIKSGKISMQAITEYLKENPQRLRSVFSFNERYIFFRQVPAGPIGCLDVQLTPKRSVALDQVLYPSGAIFLLKSAEAQFNSKGDFTGWHHFSRFVLNQDTGVAIKGKNKTDYFIGFGKHSELEAGHQYHKGNLLLLLPKKPVKEIRNILYKKNESLLEKIAPETKTSSNLDVNHI